MPCSFITLRKKEREKGGKSGMERKEEKRTEDKLEVKIWVQGSFSATRKRFMVAIPLVSLLLLCFNFINKGPSSQGYGFSSSHVWMWEFDYKENWAPKNWCFWTVMLEKTLESPLDSEEIQPVHPKENQSWLFIGRTDAEAEAPKLWPPVAKNWPIGKDPDARKD